MRSTTKRGFTLIELLVVIAIIAILASILFPVFAKAREKARQTTCTSQIRQLATAVQMYSQDNNGTYPGVDNSATWGSLIDNYVGNQKMYHCPSDANTDETAPSYGFNGALIRADGKGVAESVVASPSEVGVLCDADSSESGQYGVIGGYVNMGTTNAQLLRTPAPRHGGTIVGYCDGHAKFFAGKVVNVDDQANGVARAFYFPTALGFVDNPIGGTQGNSDKGTIPFGGATMAAVQIGGEFVTKPILTATLALWKRDGGKGGALPFNGGGTDAQPTGMYLGWGTVDSSNTNSLGEVKLYIIGSKNTTISATSSTSLNGLFNVATTNKYIPDNGPATKNYSQALSLLNSAWGTAHAYNTTSAYTECANDLEIVDKVAADSNGIGIAFSPFCDLDRVKVLNTVGTYYCHLTEKDPTSPALTNYFLDYYNLNSATSGVIKGTFLFTSQSYK